jgi:hypothetical protein
MLSLGETTETFTIDTTATQIIIHSATLVIAEHMIATIRSIIVRERNTIMTEEEVAADKISFKPELMCTMAARTSLRYKC